MDFKQKVVSRDKKNNTGRYEKIEDDMDNFSVTESVNEETIAKPLVKPVEIRVEKPVEKPGEKNDEVTAPKPELKKQKTLLELSAQCENLEDVSKKYEASSRVHVGEVFVFGHRQCSVIEDTF